MTVTTLNQTVLITDVEDVVVTDAEVDQETGDHVREIRILGPANVPVFTLRVASDDRAKINVTAPEQEF